MSDEIEPSKGWSLDRWIGVFGVVVAFAALIAAVFGIVYVKEVREGLLGTIHRYGLWPGLVLLAVFVAYLIGRAFWRTRHLRNTEERLREEESRSKQLSAENEKLRIELEATKKRKDDRGRWETVIKTKIRYGHLAYEPFLNYRPDGTPSGLGVELLRQLLGFLLSGEKVEIVADGRKRDWKSILEGLSNREYDVVATPLFATFDRSKHVSFTAPLFFSNLGLYVNKDMSFLPAWHGMTVEGMRLAIRQAGELKFLSVEGEISQKLAEKYCVKNSISAQGSGTILPMLFERIASSRDPYYALFCESFYAHIQEKVKSGEVVNVLPPHQILYPVCFAVRLGDYQLANLRGASYCRSIPCEEPRVNSAGRSGRSSSSFPQHVFVPQG